MLGMIKYLAQYIPGETTITAHGDSYYERTMCGSGNMSMRKQLRD